jgi:hypothetical protein
MGARESVMQDDRSGCERVFSQGDIVILRKALESACRALAFAFPTGKVDALTCRNLTRLIIEYAATGERNPILLSAHALGQLPPLLAARAHDPVNHPFIDTGVREAAYA